MKKQKKLFNSFEEMSKDLHKNDKYWWYQIYLFFYRLFYKIISFPGDVKRDIYFFFQRGIQGYANCDTWCFDWYLSKVISKAIKHLKKINHGLPTWIPGKTELECINEWDCILNTIISTFETAKDISENNILYLPTSKWSDEEYKRLVKFAKESRYHYKVLNKKETEEFEKGFDYFKEHFFKLWD